MSVLILIMLLSMIANGFAVKFLLMQRDDNLSLKSHLEREKSLNKMNTENIIGFLEANAETGNDTARKLLAAHSAIPKEVKKEEPLADGDYVVKGGALVRVEKPAEPVVIPPPPDPAWLHDPSVPVPPKEHWEIFLKDMGRETWGADRAKALYHWVVQLGNRFTVAEKSVVLDMFDDAEDRTVVRQVFALAEAIDKGECEKPAEFVEEKKPAKRAKAIVKDA